MPGRLYTSSGRPLPRAQATSAFIASPPRYRSPSGAMAQALTLHSSRVSPTEAGVPLFWKGTAVTRRLRSSVLSRRTDRVQNPQAPSNTRVRCCGGSVKDTKLIVPLPSGWSGTGATRMAKLRRIPLPRRWVNKVLGASSPRFQPILRASQARRLALCHWPGAREALYGGVSSWGSRALPSRSAPHSGQLLTRAA
jgi:hypothetical protein